MKIHTIVSIAITLCSVALLYLGYIARKKVLDANPCSMTYAYTGSTQVRISRRTLEGYNLWRVTYPKKDVLNKQPVLFIPGSGGRMEQARAFSSSKHNNGTFQYFVAGLGNEYSALHASTVLRHASFVNDALHTIDEIYKSENRTGVRIIILAHSVGGIVARTSLLLSNQPKGCLVKAIVMLSTPNRNPAYSPDASMELLYKTVNQAWRQSFYNESEICLKQKKRFVPHGKLDANFDCPRCTARTPLISITGGDIDGLVQPESTHLDTISPRPKNITHQKVMTSSPPSDWSPFWFISPMFWFNSAAGLVKSIVSSAVQNETSVAVDNTTSENPVSKAPEVNISTPKSYLESVTMESWDRDMAPYITPEHISLRTSQMLGYPIDHKAILWCSELLARVATTMHALSSSKHGDIEDMLLPNTKKAPSVLDSLAGSEVIKPLSDLGTLAYY